MKWFNNASITVKSLVSTACTAVVLIGMATLSTVSLLEIQRTNTTANAAILLRNQARTASSELSGGHAALYRAINLKSQNVEVAIVRAAKDNFTTASRHAREILASLNLTGLAADGQLAADTIKAFAQYGEAADQAASFVEDDAFNATMFMTDAEEKYAAAGQAATTLLDRATALASAEEERLRGVVHTALLIIPASAAIAVLLSVATTTWFGHLTSRPIVAMTAAMRRLADGDLATELPAGDRKDEVGQMAQALLVFRANAQDARRLQEAADKDHAAKARRQAAMDRYTNDFGTTARVSWAAWSGRPK
jgi:methyl-accepting chemotaxis protein